MKNFNLRTAERWITSTRFGRSLLGLKDPAELAGLLSDSFAGVESDTYTPTFGGGGITIGTGGTPVNSAHWVWEGGPNSGDAGTLEVWGEWRLGSSGFSVGTNPTIGLPSGFSITGINPFWVCGEASLVDQSTQANNRIAGIQRAPSSSTSVEVVLPQPATTITATVPFTWAADDRCRYHFRVPCVRS